MDYTTILNLIALKRNTRFLGQDVIDAEIPKLIKKNIPEFDLIFDKVNSFLEKQKSLDGALKNIHTQLKKINTNELEKGIVNLSFTGYLIGFLTADREKKKTVKKKTKAWIELFAKDEGEYSDKEFISTLTALFDKSPEIAVDYLKTKKLVISSHWTEQLEIVKKHGFTVAKVSSADALEFIHNELNTAIEEGKTIQQFKKEIPLRWEERGYAGKVPSRLDTIYRTNLQAAYMSGRYEQMNEVSEAFPYWEYVAVMDSVTRPDHAVLDGVILRSDDPFWQTHYPENGYNCRCTVIIHDDEDIDKLGVKVKDSKNTFVIDDDGNTKQVNEIKPDEGFASNPSEQWKPDLSKYSVAIKKELSSLID